MQVCREPQSTNHQNEASKTRMKTQQSHVAQLQQFHFNKRYFTEFRHAGVDYSATIKFFKKNVHS